MYYYGIIQMMLTIKADRLRIMFPENAESIHKSVMDSEKAKDLVLVFISILEIGTAPKPYPSVFTTARILVPLGRALYIFSTFCWIASRFTLAYTLEYCSNIIL